MQDPSKNTAHSSQTVHVSLGKRSYDILIGTGNLAEAGPRIADLSPSRCAIITDENVAGLYLPAVQKSIAAAGIPCEAITLPAGEATKSFSHLTDLCNSLLDIHLERGDIVIALGGGVIGDLAGFAASIVKRGVRLVQIPTTLLAQVDSSIGGKTGINTSHGKNLIGSFHQPAFVLIDTAVLNSLSAKELRAGYAEVVKYGLLGDADFFAWLEEHGLDLLSGDQAAQIKAIAQCCQSKADIVAEDETEHGRRALLNLGHTFGHALESWAGYAAGLLHGEAVSIGMVLAFRISEEMGLCPPGRSERVRAHLKAAQLPVSIAELSGKTGGTLPNADQMIKAIAQDKKAKAGKILFILVNDIGQAFVSNAVTPERLEAFLGAECRGLAA